MFIPTLQVGKLAHRFIHILDTQVFNRRQKSNKGIKVREGLQKDEVDLVMKSPILLPLMLEWLSTKRKSITNPERSIS